MVFSSHLFLFYFLTATLVLYYISPRWLKHLTLAAVSYVFYGWANPLFVVLTLKQALKLADSPPVAGRELIVSGTIAAKSAAPRAGQMPYAHHIFTLDLGDLQVHGGALTEPKIAVYLFSMRNQHNTPAFSWPVGKRVKLKIQPWRPGFSRQYGRINRTDSDDIELERPWWGEVIE